MAEYTIRFMPDYHATSLWPVSKNAYSDLGIPIRYETVGLSKKLIERLEKFDESILSILDWDDPGKGCILSYEESNKMYQEGLTLLELVRSELGEKYEVQECLDWIKPKD